MKIYTRTGDDGTTGLFGGQRVCTSDLRIECTGASMRSTPRSAWPQPCRGADAGETARVQNDLFVIGSHLATPPDAPATASLPPLDEAIVARLEMQIDAADATLTPLRNFILPGGSELAARLHVARTTCRRAERLSPASPKTARSPR